MTRINHAMCYYWRTIQLLNIWIFPPRNAYKLLPATPGPVVSFITCGRSLLGSEKFALFMIKVTTQGIKFACMHLHTYGHTGTRTPTHINTHTHPYICTNTHTHLHPYTCTHTHTYTTYTPTYRLLYMLQNHALEIVN